MQNKEKTAIDRLFNLDNIDKNDIIGIEESINQLIGQNIEFNKKNVELKTVVDSLVKKIDNIEQLTSMLTRKIDEMNQQITGVNNMFSPGSFNSSPFTNSNNLQRQQIQYNPQARVQPRDSRLGFDPMSVSAPNQEGIVQPMTPQQQAELMQQQRLIQQRAMK